MASGRSQRLPKTIEPALATLVATIPLGNDWVHELKYDGYRILARIEDGKVALFTRRGNNWTARFPAVAHALATLQIESAFLDGEVVALDEKGRTDFQRLQNWLQAGDDQRLVYYVFDVPYANGSDLRDTQLIERKSILASLLGKSGSQDDGIVRYSEHVRDDGPKVIQYACQAGIEGVVSKLANSRYLSGRTKNWVKTKCHQRQEFVIGGFTQPSGGRNGFGSLLLGYYRDSRLLYAGHVGTGFSHQSLEELGERLDALRTKTSPFATPPRSKSHQRATWVKPRLVAEVEFTEWTKDGILRHPSFKGLRQDKPPEDIVQERPSNSKATKT